MSKVKLLLGELPELLHIFGFDRGPDVNAISLKRLTVDKYILKSDIIDYIESRYMIFPIHFKNINIDGMIVTECINIILVDMVDGYMERFNMYTPSYSEPGLDDLLFDHITIKIQRHTPNFNPSIMYPSLQTSDKKYALKQILYYMDLRLSNIQINRDNVIDTFIKTADLPTLVSHYEKILDTLLIPRPGIYTGELKNKINVVLLCNPMRYNIPNDISNYIKNDGMINVVEFVNGDYKSMEALKNMGLFQYDYVISMNCPGFSNIDEIQLLLRTGRWLLKPSSDDRKSKMIMPNLLKSSIFLLDSSQLGINYPGDATYDNYMMQYRLGNVVGMDEELSRIQYEELYQSYNVFGDTHMSFNV